MEEADYHLLERWGWFCHTCGHFNENDEDPLEGILDCQECNGKFKGIPE